MNQQRIMIIGGQPIITESISISLAQYTSFEVVTSQKVDDTASLAISFRPHLIVIIIDQSTATDGLIMCRELNEYEFEPRIVILAPHSLTNGEQFLLESIRVGANALFTWEELTLSQFANVLKEVLSGQNVFDMQKLRRALAAQNEVTQQPPSIISQEHFTKREYEVATLIAQGFATDAISQRLSITHRTVQSHISSILAKLNVSSRAEAVARLHQCHQITQEDKKA
jgi:DNA-binding NarL/FixJ family response regulator